MAIAAKPVLMLPAPVENPVMAELNALAGSLAAPRDAEPAVLIRQARRS